MISIMLKITEHKLNETNYLDWSRMVRIYLQSIDKDDHLNNEPPTDDTRQVWLREDAQLFLHIRNSIDKEEDKSLTTYFMEFKKAYKEFNVLLSFSPREQMTIMSFLVDLPSKFETAKSHILSRSKISFLQDIFTRMLCIENTHSAQTNNSALLRKQKTILVL
ncbi:hypothetical protein ES332_D03G087500v1 [Gossypium tomentosum]|uniref:Retrotransposon Copia-like N-terminal domain-containing protein n=1 Tax=Gossypium tomentosum TaxID=34277 RepID=A0A5D2LKD8_GOSTO|nr:hypothetical protein ES332_D03G087500v1 [Gossypium tomentosum]